MGKKVFVGLSGGVDSATSAALLKERGYDVTGVFIKGWQPDFLSCPWAEDRADAIRVCAHLGIPFETLDLSDLYEKEIGEYLISEYKDGRTPNPDVLCNRVIKFGAFFDYALSKGADFVATGHYAQIKKGNLVKGNDPQKDQTYFLWMLTKREIEKTLFPVGGFEKSYVRELAEKFNLPNAVKKDSQGLCFLGKLDMGDFLKHYIPVEKGKVLNTAGEIIGEHEGAALYTVGQRHGLTIKVHEKESLPHFVLSTDVKTNTVVATPNIEEVGKKEIKLQKTNWISELPHAGGVYQGRTRYRQTLTPCTIEIKGENAAIHFENAVISAPGQSCVIYDGEICVGGGIIT